MSDDTATHRPVSHALAEGFQVTCPCGWRSGIWAAQAAARAMFARHKRAVQPPPEVGPPCSCGHLSAQHDEVGCMFGWDEIPAATGGCLCELPGGGGESCTSCGYADCSRPGDLCIPSPEGIVHGIADRLMEMEDRLLELADEWERTAYAQRFGRTLRAVIEGRG